MHFVKLHGCGNDFVCVDALRHPPPEDPAAAARAVCDRRRGVGADGLLLLVPARDAGCALRMAVRNADGSAAETCGNGLRCAARLAWEHGHLRGDEARIETDAGPVDVRRVLRDGALAAVRVDMGRPRLAPDAVPVLHPGPGPVLDLRIALPGRGTWDCLAVGMGNPHAVCFVDGAIEDVPLSTVGPLIERHERFPRGTNVEFVARLADEDGRAVLRQRTWERGSGETAACGSGACATVVAAVLSGRVPPGEHVVRLDGGDLLITWAGGEAPVTMEGEAVRVFEGDWPA